MRPVDHIERLLADMHSGSNEAIIAAAKRLLELGEYGSPAGTYLLAGGKAALRAGRLADAVVLLHRGLQVAEPHTKLWADLLVSHAGACAKHGFARNAITDGEQFLHAVPSLPAETHVLIPYAHHAVGFGYDELKEHRKAATHYRLAAETHSDPVQRAIATSDLAFALALAGEADEADQALQPVESTHDEYATFVLAGTTAIVRCHQGRFSETVAEAERAEALAIGNEERWAVPMAETQYWHARAAYQLGDRYRAGALALQVALVACKHWRLELERRASAFLAEIMDKGGIR